MPQPHIHGRLPSFSASKALVKIGDDLRAIKEQDGLTWKDVGRVLGKSDDRAADYATAMSEMPVTAFLLACREWNGRFANGVMAMIGQKVSLADNDYRSDGDRLSRILRLAHQISTGVNDEQTPGRLDDQELIDIGAQSLDDAARAIDALRIRLANISGAEELRVVRS